MTNFDVAHLTKEEALYQLLKKEHGYYSTILEITRQENEKLLSHQPLSTINPLLKQKKIILVCIAEVESAMQPLKKHWQSKRDRSDPLSKKIKEKVSILDQLLKDILHLDIINQRSLEEYLQSLRDQAQPPPPVKPNPLFS